MVSWKEQQKIIYDIKQYKLNPDLTISKNNFRFAKEESDIKYDEVVLCPFCLMSYELGKFALRKGLRVCPCCGTKLKLSTLSEIRDLNKFVQFVYNYRLNGFWGKICMDIPQKTHDTRFNEWNKRLSNLGLSRDFWDNYKRLRGDIEEC
jgi:hypothetical protein